MLWIALAIVIAGLLISRSLSSQAKIQREKQEASENLMRKYDTQAQMDDDLIEAMESSYKKVYELSKAGKFDKQISEELNIPLKRLRDIRNSNSYKNLAKK